MAKKKATKRSRPKKKTTTKRRSKRSISPQTNEPFEQDAKRRIGQYGGAGEPPLMKK
jgi:hypothetical protein